MLRMIDEPNYLQQAQEIAAGRSALLPQVEHLAALIEQQECQAIKFALALDRMKTKVLNGESL